MSIQIINNILSIYCLRSITDHIHTQHQPSKTTSINTITNKSLSMCAWLKVVATLIWNSEHRRIEVLGNRFPMRRKASLIHMGLGKHKHLVNRAAVWNQCLPRSQQEFAMKSSSTTLGKSQFSQHFKKL